MRAPVLTILCLFPLLILMGCRADSVRWDGQIIQEDGVSVVQNSGPPLAREGSVQAIVRWSVTVRRGEDLWQQPSQIVADQNRLYLVDPQASRIHVVATSGEVQPSIGREGAGPGEFRRLMDLVPVRSRLVVLDQAKTSLEVLDGDGIFIRSVPIDMRPFQALAFGEEALAVFGFTGEESEWIRVTLSGDRTPLHLATIDPLPEEGERSCLRWSTYSQRFVGLRCATGEIVRLSEDGHVVKRVILPFEPEELSTAQLDHFLDYVRQSMLESGASGIHVAQQLRTIRGSTILTNPFRKVVFDPATGVGGVWEQTRAEYGSGPARLHLVSDGGIYLAEMTFPDPWADFDLVGGVVYALEKEAQTGLITLTAYEISMEDEVLPRAAEVLEAYQGR